MTERQEIRAFLERQRPGHPAPDLLDRFLVHACDLETQVVALEGGYPIRIPKHANSEPEYQDREQRWSLDKYALKIGTTGWDWVNRRSLWLGYDFDGIDHAAGIEDAKLAQVIQAASRVPYLEVRRSTGGKGLHIYALLGDGIPDIKNHGEHTRLGRAVLEQMSKEAAFDFGAHVDVVAGNLWIWCRQ